MGTIGKWRERRRIADQEVQTIGVQVEIADHFGMEQTGYVGGGRDAVPGKDVILRHAAAAENIPSLQHESTQARPAQVG